MFKILVRWIFCPNCKRVVDEFEMRCGWCGSTEGIKILEGKS